jgi:hypothetical protein
VNREAGASGGMWPAWRELVYKQEHKAQSTKCMCMCMCRKSGGVEVRESRLAMLPFKGYLRLPSNDNPVENVSMLHKNVVRSDCSNYSIIITIWKTNKLFKKYFKFETSRIATYPGKYCTSCPSDRGRSRPLCQFIWNGLANEKKWNSELANSATRSSRGFSLRCSTKVSPPDSLGRNRRF